MLCSKGYAPLQAGFRCTHYGPKVGQQCKKNGNSMLCNKSYPFPPCKKDSDSNTVDPEVHNSVDTASSCVLAEAGSAVQHADGPLSGCPAELKGFDRAEDQRQQPHVSPPAPLLSVYASLAFASLVYASLAFASLVFASLVFEGLGFASMGFASLVFASLAFASLVFASLVFCKPGVCKPGVCNFGFCKPGICIFVACCDHHNVTNMPCLRPVHEIQQGTHDLVNVLRVCTTCPTPILP